MELVLGFVLSYLANNIPTWNEIVGKNKDLADELEKCYQNALKKWCKNDSIRKSMSARMFSHMGDLKNYLQCSEHVNEEELIKLWVDELRGNETCYNFINETKLDSIIEISRDNNNLLSAIDQKADIIIHNIKPDRPLTLKRGLTKHKAVKGYIRRYCSSDRSENNFISYLLGQKDRKCLAEYVVGLTDVESNKFILYSSAQTGKTTELKELCWELQQSGLYLPIIYEVRINTTLKRNDLPDYQNTDGKEVVVVIDALDEVNGQKYDDLIEEISGYAYDHPNIKIVLSCRSNYRRVRQLDVFKELFLEELTSGDIKEHIENVLGKGRSIGLIKQINDKELGDFAQNPFFLNVLIEAYKDSNKQLPSTKAEIYRLFIEKSYNEENENKNLALDNRHNFDESLKLLERVALALSLMNVQSLNKDELQTCLGNDENVTECLRYDLIQCEDGAYSFKHNAFREWLVANYLLREGLNRAKQLATHPNERIKPEWYNIIMLWVSMYGENKQDEINAILDWLKQASMDLVIYIDRKMLDERIRNEVFKGLLLEYKSLGIRMSNIMLQDYKNLLDFGLSEDTIVFITDELREAKSGTAYYADLMCMCYFLKWDRLEIRNKELVDNLFDILIKKTEEALIEKPSHDLSFLYFDNPFFAQKEYYEKIFSIVESSNHYEAIRSMIRLIADADVVDEFIDYILDKEQYVCNQQEGHTTQIVSRTPVYHALSKVKSLDSVKKILAHTFHNPHSYYRDEWSEYAEMMKNVLGILSNAIRDGQMELCAILEDFFCKVFKDYHYHIDHNDNSYELLCLLRDCYLNAGLREHGRTQFYCFVQTVFDPHTHEEVKFDEMRKAFGLAALWMTVDDVKEDFSKFSADNEYDRAKASRYDNIPYKDVAEYASMLYREKYPEPEIITKGRKRQRRSLDDFADYQVFKQIVLEMVSTMSEQTTRRDHRRWLQQQESGYNQYAYRFFLRFPDNSDGYDKEGIVKGIKNRELYEAFFMQEIIGIMTYPVNNVTLNEDMKVRCIKCAKEIVINLCKGGNNTYFYKDALSLLLKGEFEIPNELLPNLLNYSKINISRRNQDEIFSSDYTLFEYISERVDVITLAPIVIRKFHDCVNDENSPLSYIFANYIVENRIEEGYALALRFALSQFSYSSNILELLIQNNILLEDIKDASDKMPVSGRLFCYGSIARHTGDYGWVKSKLEPVFKSYEGYELRTAVKLLLSIGSLDALYYLSSNPELLKSEFDFNLNYDNPNATPSICFLIKYCSENRIEGMYLLNSLLSSLERIALRSEEALLEVKQYLRDLTKRGEQFKYLNRSIITFEDKYYAKFSGYDDVKKVMNMIDASAISVINAPEGKIEKTDEEEKVVYISYSWQGESGRIVDYFCYVLETKGIRYKRDKKDCLYTDNIKEFMDAIRAGWKVVVVFSRPYLKSKNCMYELSGIMEDPCYKNRILPVVVDNDIRESQFYLDLVTFWKEKRDEQKVLVEKLIGIDPEMAWPEREKLDEMEAVYKLVPYLKKYIDWANADSLDSLCATQFKSIIDKIREG